MSEVRRFCGEKVTEQWLSSFHVCFQHISFDFCFTKLLCAQEFYTNSIREDDPDYETLIWIKRRNVFPNIRLQQVRLIQ